MHPNATRLALAGFAVVSDPAMSRPNRVGLDIFVYRQPGRYATLKLDNVMMVGTHGDEVWGSYEPASWDDWPDEIWAKFTEDQMNYLLWGAVPMQLGRQALMQGMTP